MSDKLGYEPSNPGPGKPGFANKGGNKERQDGKNHADKVNAADHLSNKNGQCNPTYER